MKPTANHNHREGPPRYFQPVCVRTEQGYTFHGWMGYEEIPADDVGECPVEARTDKPEKARKTMRDEIEPVSEKRWAIANRFDGVWMLLGRNCWTPAVSHERHPTFSTRQEARKAKSQLTSYRQTARVVPVEVLMHSR